MPVSVLAMYIAMRCNYLTLRFNSTGLGGSVGGTGAPAHHPVPAPEDRSNSTPHHIFPTAPVRQGDPRRQTRISAAGILRAHHPSAPSAVVFGHHEPAHPACPKQAPQPRRVCIVHLSHLWFSRPKRGTASGRCKSYVAGGRGCGGRDRSLLAL